MRGLGVVLLAGVCACAKGAELDDDVTTTLPGTTVPTTGTGAEASSGPDATGDDESTTGEVTTSDTESTGDDTGDPSSTGETTFDPDAPYPARYPPDRVHSPITDFVAEHLQAVAAVPTGANKNDAMFAKLGGTAAASPNFMHCFANDALIIDVPDTLQTTLQHFRMGGNNEDQPVFDRTSLGAGAGWLSGQLTSGRPTPIAAEIAAAQPRFAHLMIGIDDAATAAPDPLWEFADNLLDVLDLLLAEGVVPIVTSVPGRADLGHAVWIARYEAVIRAAAQGRQVPLLDLGPALANLTDKGLTDEGLDLNVFVSGGMERPCHFTEAAVLFGYNRYNLEALRGLDRVRQVVVDQVAELDPPGPRLDGKGTPDDPFVIDALPFVDLRSTLDSPSSVFDGYTGVCNADTTVGPESVYQLQVKSDVNIRVMAFDRGAVDVDVYVLNDPTATSCLGRGDREVFGPLTSGTYYIAIDSSAIGTAGEYMLAVIAE